MFTNKAQATPIKATCFQGSVPGKMVKLTNMNTIESDFKVVLDFVRDTGTPLVIKNSGHDWKGRSSGAGSIALWTHNLRHPNVPIVFEKKFTPESCTSVQGEAVFHVGPGQNWGGLYEFAENIEDDEGYAVLGGTCGTVGVAGWLHGGGHSPFTPFYGMGVDNVLQIEIITPQGKKLVANQCQNEDLFFAVRGGGGGTFGLVTNITYKALKKFSLQVRAHLFVNAAILTIFNRHTMLRSTASITQHCASFGISSPPTPSRGRKKDGEATSRATPKSRSRRSK